MSKHLRFLALMLIVVVSLVSTGCDEEKVRSEVVPNLVEKVVKDTEKAISTKDVNLARETWSKVTEYSVKAQELENEDIPKALSCLATTYVKLIEYCESGDESLLEEFKTEFEKALEKLEDIQENLEETQA